MNVQLYNFHEPPVATEESLHLVLNQQAQVRSRLFANRGTESSHLRLMVSVASLIDAAALRVTVWAQ